MTAPPRWCVSAAAGLAAFYVAVLVSWQRRADDHHQGAGHGACSQMRTCR